MSEQFCHGDRVVIESLLPAWGVRHVAKLTGRDPEAIAENFPGHMYRQRVPLGALMELLPGRTFVEVGNLFDCSAEEIAADVDFYGLEPEIGANAGKPIEWTEAMDNRIMKEYRSTETKVLAETMGCDPATIRRRAKFLGLNSNVTDPWAGATVAKWAPEVDAYLTELWGSGLTCTQMADKMSERFNAKITKNMVIRRSTTLDLPR